MDKPGSKFDRGDQDKPMKNRFAILFLNERETIEKQTRRAGTNGSIARAVAESQI